MFYIIFHAVIGAFAYKYYQICWTVNEFPGPVNYSLSLCGYGLQETGDRGRFSVSFLIEPGGERRKRCHSVAFSEGKSDLESFRARFARREYRPRCVRESLRNEQCEALQASSAKIEIADIRTHCWFEPGGILPQAQSTQRLLLSLQAAACFA